MSDGRIVIDTILKKDKTDKDIKDFQKSIGNISAKAKTVGKEMTKYLTLPLIAIGTAAFASANDLDKAYKNIRAGTGATGDALEELKADFKEVFKNVPDDADKVSNALADINTRLGLTGEPLQDMTEQMLTLSRVAKEDVGSIIASTTRMFGDWDVAIEDTSGSLDMLWKVSQNTGIGVNKLAENLVSYGAPLRAFGYSMEESAIMMGKWEKEGVNLELIMGSLKQGLGHFAREGIDAKEGLEDIIEAMRNAKTDTEAVSMAMEVFGARAGPDMAMAVREGRFEIDELINAVNESGETIQAAGQDTLTFGERMANLKNQATVGLEPLGRIFLDLAEKYLPPAIEAITRLAEWFGNLSPEGQKVVVIVGAIVAAVGPMLLLFTKVVSIFTTLAPIAKLLGVAIGGISLPVLGVIAGITLLIAAGVALWRNWDTVKSKSVQLWNGIVNAVRGPANGLIGFANGIISAYERMINGVAGAINRMPSINIPDWVPVLGGKSFGIPNIPEIKLPKIPSLATGGVAEHPMLAMIGDAGVGNPEVVAPERMLRDIFSSELSRHGGGQAGFDVSALINKVLDKIVLDNRIEIDGHEIVHATGKPMMRYIDEQSNGAGRRKGHVR